MRFHEIVLTNTDVANYLKNIQSDTIHFTEEQIYSAILSGDRYGLEIATDSSIILSDFLDDIGYPIDVNTLTCLDLVISHKDDRDSIYGTSVAQYLLYRLLGISATEMIFIHEGSSVKIMLGGILSISWSFFNKIYEY
jgi:hypothetical protein